MLGQSRYQMVRRLAVIMHTVLRDGTTYLPPGLNSAGCCHVWMAPFMQGFFRLMLIVAGCGHVSGLLTRSI